MGLGLSQASIVSSVADATGDDSSDAVVKIKRLINQVGPDFCMITDWPFLRHDISFDITTSAYTFSGASYLPQTFKKALDAFILHNARRYPLEEDSLQESGLWLNPAENTGFPDRFVITRPESDYWEIKVNRQPDQTYTVYMEIEKQWVDLTSSNETVITKEYYSAFCHLVTTYRFLQQGDSENYTIFNNQWDDPRSPQKGILGRILRSMKKPLKKTQVTPRYRPHAQKSDYNLR